jgi:putative ABC transport system ATP-binding protein
MTAKSVQVAARESLAPRAAAPLLGVDPLIQRNPLIEVNQVTRHFVMGGETIAALDGVSFTIARGECVAIVGSSGSGKSTLMNILGCLDVPSSGAYRLDGHDVRGLGDDALSALRNRQIGFIFQSFQLLPRQTALANVELPLVYRGMSARHRRPIAERALERVGLGHRSRHLPNQLSGGQRQRVSIARALVTEPSILLADEPTGNLDSATGREILELFRELHAAGNTILLVTHEPAIAAACPRRIRLSDGRIAEDAGEGSTAGSAVERA